MEDENKIDVFNPGTLMFFIMAVLSDFSALLLVGLAIPGIGFAFAGLFFLAHYFFGLLCIVYFWGKTKGGLPKIILLLSWLLPLPLLAVGLVLAIVASNKIAAFLIEQVAIQAIAIGTAGAGEALEGAALAGEAAEVGVEATEAVGAAAEGVQAASEGVGAVAEGAEAAGGTVAQGAETAAGEAGGATAESQEVEEAGRHAADEFTPEEERNPMENLEKDLSEPSEDRFGQEVSEEEEPEPEAEDTDEKRKRNNKVVDITRKALDRATATDEEGENGEEDQEDDTLDQAA